MRALARVVSVSSLGGALIASLLVAPVLVAPALAADPIPPAAPAAEPAVTDPKRGTITWGECPAERFDGFECGVLTVPLDWDDLSNPANAEIALTVKRAVKESTAFTSSSPSVGTRYIKNHNIFYLLLILINLHAGRREKWTWEWFSC